VDFSRLGPPRGSRLLVVGGCGGIGRALVAAALETGLRVAVFDLPKSMEEHRPSKDVEFSFGLDATDERAVHQAFHSLEDKFQGLDGLVNLAGFTNLPTPVANIGPKEFDTIVSGSLWTTYNVAHAALPLMRKAGRGAIVHTASGLAVRLLPGFGPYGAAKAGVIGLTKAIAVENAPAIRANTIAPGVIDTEFHVGGTGREHPGPEFIDAEAYAKTVPMRRIGVPEDVVGPILFLLGPASGFMTGQTLFINGGGLTP
jgi:3-oxoacyl-[acyl-carrier protein] reductase